MKRLRPVLERLEAHARESEPAECRGILPARASDPETIPLALRAENAEVEHPDRRYVLGHRAHPARSLAAQRRSLQCRDTGSERTER